MAGHLLKVERQWYGLVSVLRAKIGLVAVAMRKTALPIARLGVGF